MAWGLYLSHLKVTRQIALRDYDTWHTSGILRITDVALQEISPHSFDHTHLEIARLASPEVRASLRVRAVLGQWDIRWHVEVLHDLLITGLSNVYHS